MSGTLSNSLNISSSNETHVLVIFYNKFLISVFKECPFASTKCAFNFDDLDITKIVFNIQ